MFFHKIDTNTWYQNKTNEAIYKTGLSLDNFDDKLFTSQPLHFPMLMVYQNYGSFKL